MDQEKVVLLYKATEGCDDAELVALFTGPEATERAHEVQRLKSMADDDMSWYLDNKRSNPRNEELGLGPALADVATDPFVHAAVSSIFTHSSATVPAWLNIEWLCFEVERLTNEKIRIDGRILRLDPPQRWILGHDPVQSALDGAGFVETEL